MKLYDWNALPKEQLNPLMTRRAIHGDTMTIARIELQKGVTVTPHSHVHEQMSMVERGAIKFQIEGREQIVRAGEVLSIPPHAPHGIEALEDSVVVDVFAPAREDWIRGDDAYLRR